MAGALTDFYNSINAVEVTTASTVFKLCLSMMLGCCVGVERKRKGQIAGIRTFALISMGATLAMILSIYVPQEYLGLKNGDPGRIAAQVITGIGFLGAGAIIQMKGSVRGLTTAASIWMVATIGMAVGVGMYLVSMVATALILVVLLFIEAIERKVHVGWETRIIRIRVHGIIEDINPYRSTLAEYHIGLTNVYAEYDYEACVTRLNLVVLVKSTTDFISLFSAMRSINETQGISLANQVSI
ncbi:MAG: MgtC/SapB family protein [Muribaculaceae bacterium]|jgi:putative Mg2+ transporter-C (MgtC) family protein|nr:MgtC/SapB family protein [Muribaculaceae bacterium]